MTMTRDEVFQKVRTVLIDALSVDEEEVTPDATLREDLGAESIDFLDVVFRLEKEFGIRIPRGELFPENALTDAEFVRDGRVTPAGLAELKKRMPHSDFSKLDADPQVNNVQSLFTVDAVVNYIHAKLGG